MPLAYQLDVVTALVILIFLFTIGSLRSLVKGNWRKNVNREQTLYEDKDGIASPESTSQFSNKWQYIVIFALNSIGLGLSIANAIYAIVKEKSGTARTNSNIGSNLLIILAWCLVLLQLIDASVQPAPVVRFKATIAKLTSCFLLGGMIWVSLLGDADTIVTTLSSVQMGAILALIAAVAALRRRPKLFRPDGHIVDQEKNVSLWSRYTFNWAVDALAAASKEKFENSDVPAISHNIKSEVVVERFKGIVLKDNMPLWLQIFWAFKGPLLLQWSSILFSNFFDVAPAFAVLQLLKYLETRTDPNAIEPGAWKYVVGIAVATTSSHCVDSRIMWWAKANLVVPLRSVLTGLMYDKLLKVHSSSEPPEAESLKAENNKLDDAKDLDQKQAASQQDVVNMFAVDCLEIATFGESNSEYVNTAGKLVVTVVFLLLLIGWQSLCAGMIGIAVLFPINKVLSERYGKKQTKLMEIRDKRTKITTEALLGIRQIKFSATEGQWAEKLEAVREEELSMLWKTRIDNLYMSIAAEFTPVLLTALSLATYSWVNGTLLPSVAFTAISLFIQLEGIVSYIPYLTVAAINAKVSCDRIQNFLRLPEKPETTVPGESITFHNATVTFPHETTDPNSDQFTLRGLNLQFPNNALSVISGPTGAGKSLLLASILGEVDLLTGFITVPRFSGQRYDSKATAADWIIPNALSFVSQMPWIENATIKNNITFGLPFDPIRYQKVIEACALTHDLAILEDGDETEVGAQGISLSGGQKWRLTLARAFYSRAGILILDDVFSALDAHVGKHIYDNAVNGELAEGRTRILATHHTSLCLPRAKYAVHLSARGEIEHAGTIEQLREEDVLDDILKADDTTESTFIEEDEVLRAETTDTAAAILPKDVPVAVKAAPKKLIEDERREIGRVKTRVYAGYLGASGGLLFWLFLVSMYIVSETFTIGRTYWVRIWSSDDGYEQAAPVVSFLTSQYHNVIQPRFSNQQPINSMQFIGTMNSSAATSASFPIEIQNRSLWFYLWIYCSISLVSVVLFIFRLYLVYAGSIKASRRIFRSTLHGVLRAPLRWLDTVPMGRILNRFTGDFTTIDSSLASDFSVFAGLAMEISGILITASFVSPFVIICAVVLLAVCSSFAITFINAARNMKRLYSTNKSPLISHFAASLSGLTTIRAFDKSSEFRDRMGELLDTYAACSWYDSLFKSWLGLRIGITASFFSASVAAFVVTQRGIDASLAGFVMSFALHFGWCVSRTIRLSTQLELDMNAAERIFEYRDLTTEVQTGEEVPASWPQEGRVEVKDLEIGYADGLPSVLKGLSFTAEKNQRIGVIGRTGAGKSTLSLALFRFLPARSGSITIDGIDISKIKLYDLRTRLAIIPQDPVLFSGTIRSNLDPFDEFSDYQLNEALTRVHLIASSSPTPIPNPSSSNTSTLTNPTENKNIFLSLSAPIASGGSNLSQGQKQLLCLARAILSRPKVLLLDEATSAVDMSTDLLIQRSIRDEFTDTTLLVIAHRLSTIADFDRILVIKDGKNAEFGSPKELLGIEGGLFRGMVEQSGEKEELERIVEESSRE